ncbi:MAG: zinc ABC transporter ATP-binding protein ZnuC [Alphaproteobacteria bacterium]|nr:zinc ABC transporter ATP-binding protein ZnuC [Alphaproteobacteria bacterium]
MTAREIVAATGSATGLATGSGSGLESPGAGEILLEAAAVDLRLGALEVLQGVDLTVRRGEIVTLIGPNGAGKTTLVRVVLGLVRPDRGRVALAPDLVIGYVPQRLHVDPVLPLDVRRFLTLGGAAGRERCQRALDEVGVSGLLDAALHELSGGELRRVVLARALLRDPDLLVLDEPVQGVDLGGQIELYELISRLRGQRACGVLMVSHDLHLVMAATDHVVCLNHHVCCAGRPETVSRDPEYITLFGPRAAEALALYSHAHDHRHDTRGNVVPLEDGAAEPGAPEPKSGER